MNLRSRKRGYGNMVSSFLSAKFTNHIMKAC
nr:MAG TPA: hypothetical protein [Herelleviridae sp.]